MATSITEILELERLEKDIYRGGATETTLQRTFGGQVAAQALGSAVRTVSPEYRVHSLHGYFLRPGNPAMPIVHLVDRIRDGRSFVTRRVSAIQDGNAIFTMSASFHVGDAGIEHQDEMPSAPAPEDVVPVHQSTDPADAWLFSEWADWDLRIVPRSEVPPLGGSAARKQVWFRSHEDLPDDPVFHVCTLAYMSDMTLLGTSRVPHADTPLQVASLDHAMWFLRPFRADEWLLYDQLSPFAGFGRALTQGRIFTRDGTLVAAVVQEGLTRTPRA